ncbi:hypothetical protein OOK41_04510 [Micromonospora sp. NBC_01655]|uniref:hypothetical protein n=1 Tax=Micromonospora sp. NBC_01655 TaxID=2975983 RepID=UPI0022576684|nr:hypothetical protein [Micromonospora sp. NBC_01655]MCX4469567.1 hypothetical protein [Micromonospora sp. NBC_01655]
MRRIADLPAWTPVGVGLLAAMAALAGGCAARTTDAGTAGPQLGGVQQSLDRLARQIDGDLDDRRAGQLLTYVAYQRPIRDCMADAKLDYTPPRFVNPYEHWQAVRPLSMYDEIVPVDTAHVTANGLYVAADLTRTPTPDSDNPGHDRLNKAGKAAYAAQVTKCQPPAKEYQNAGTPALSAKLFADLDTLVGSVVSTSEVKAQSAGYATCMAKRGINAANREELAGVVRNSYAPLLDTDSGRLAVATTSPQFVTAKAGEQTAAQADADCRRPAYELTLTLLEPKLAAFEADHATELTQMAADWAGVRARATQAEKTIDW